MMQRKYMQKQSGFSLVELMIGMVLGLVLVAAVIQLFVANKATYRTMEGLSAIQENARFTFDFMSRDIRMAGFMGCYQGTGGDTENILNDQSNLGWDLTKMVSGYNNVDATFSAVPNVVLGTDVVVVRGLSDGGIKLVAPYSDSAQIFVDPSATNFVDGEVLMITDCSQSTIFQATNIQAAGGKINIVHSGNNSFSPGNSSPQKANVYAEGAEIARLNTYAYYIRLNPAGNRALYRSRLAVSAGTTAALSAEELVEGVENMQIEYGVDTTGDEIPDSYVDADAVDAAVGWGWENVITVRTGLLFNSIGTARSSADTGTYALSTDTTYDPADDRQLRKMFFNAVAIRNNLPE